MSGWRRSLHRRLTIAQALAMALVFLALGTALYKGLEARLVELDHERLRRHALLVQRLVSSEAAGDDPGALQRRLDDLQLIHPDLRVALGGAAGPAGADVAGAPIRALVQDGVALEVLDLSVVRRDGSVVAVRLALPMKAREQALAGYRQALLAVALVGVLVSIALSAATLRWGVRSLRRLSWEAGRVASGGRISTHQVDGELVELVQAFNATLDQLEQAQRQSDAFSADVAHELRSPLATLIGGTQFMLSRPRTEQQLREALASNLEELERLKTLVNDMLFLARADQGERAQSLERVDLGQLADATLDYCAVLLDEAGLRASRLGTASAVCNAALVRRAMTNLLSNAIQHASGDRRVELHLQALPGKVRMWVFNAGQPLAPEVVERMFDRFYRASEARSRQGDHHGLGLAIVQAVARMHGGSVFAQPQVDGNAIGFEIPGALATRQRRLREPEHDPA